MMSDLYMGSLSPGGGEEDLMGDLMSTVFIEYNELIYWKFKYSLAAVQHYTIYNISPILSSIVKLSSDAHVPIFGALVGWAGSTWAPWLFYGYAV